DPLYRRPLRGRGLDHPGPGAAPRFRVDEGPGRQRTGGAGRLCRRSRAAGSGRRAGRRRLRRTAGRPHESSPVRALDAALALRRPGHAGADRGPGLAGRAAALAHCARRHARGDPEGRMNPPAIALENVTKLYGTVAALQSVNLRVEAGSWLALMGPSGSGKTTLVNLIGCLDQPSAGAVRIDGTDVSSFSRRELTRFRAEKIGFIFQQFHLVPYLSALENVMLAQYFHSSTDEAEARAALDRVGLAARAGHLPGKLSGGEQQRVAVARALINHPKLILADEPTGNLDEANEKTVIRLLRDLHSEGHTILIVTHDPSIGSLADRRIQLAHGRLAQITIHSSEDEARIDHMLEELWLCAEIGKRAKLARFHS